MQDHEATERLVRAGDLVVGEAGRALATGSQRHVFIQRLHRHLATFAGEPISVDAVHASDGTIVVDGGEDGALVLVAQAADPEQLVLCRFYQA